MDGNAMWKDLSDQLSHIKKGFGGEGSESKLSQWMARFEEFRRDRGEACGQDLCSALT